MKIAAWLLLGGLGWLSGCERGMHQMYDQPRYKPLTPSPLFADGNSSRPQVEGTVVHSAGAGAGASSGRLGIIEAVAGSVPVTLSALRRGRERFEIYCAPCHGGLGDGQGVIALRGFPAPPSFHIERLRRAPDRHYVDVISNGYGAMFPYGDRIAEDDRWRIVAYVRALQLSRHVPAALLDEDDLSRLQQAPP